MSKGSEKIVGEILERRYVVLDLLEDLPYGGRFSVYDLEQLTNVVLDVNLDPTGQINSYRLASAKVAPPRAKKAPAPEPAPPPPRPTELLLTRQDVVDQRPPSPSPIPAGLLTRHDVVAQKIETAWFAMAEQEELYDPEVNDYREWQTSLEDLAEELSHETYTQFSLDLSHASAALSFQQAPWVEPFFSSPTCRSSMGPLIGALTMTGVMSLLLLWI